MRQSAVNVHQRFISIAGAIVAGVIASTTLRTGLAHQGGAPVFVTTIPPGYRDWRLVSVAHEEGNLNDIRAILGNDIAIGSLSDTFLIHRLHRGPKQICVICE